MKSAISAGWMLKVIVNSSAPLHQDRQQAARDRSDDPPAPASIPSQSANLLDRTEYQLLLAICILSAVYSFFIRTASRRAAMSRTCRASQVSCSSLRSDKLSRW